MEKFALRTIFVIILLVINSIKPINGQSDSLANFTESFSGFNDNVIQGLPVVNINDIFELNPLMYRCNFSNSGSYYSGGFLMSKDYTWFDGVPFRFAEEMPLRLIGSAQFNSFEDYFEHGNSLSGTCSFMPVSKPDSFSLKIESNATLIHKLYNDNDLQLILSGPVRFNKSGGKRGVSVSYMLASRLFSSADAYPSYIKRDRASDEYLDYLADNPLRASGEDGYGTYANALFTETGNSVSSYFNSNAGK